MITNLQIAVGMATVTPSDTTEISSGALWIGGGGDLAVVMEDGSTGTFDNVPEGALLPFSVRKVLSTGTTCTLIKALK